MGWRHMSLRVSRNGMETHVMRVSRNGMETHVTEGLKEWDGDTCH